MKDTLLVLLYELEEIGDDHEELFDSEVRERMGLAIFNGFVKQVPGYKVPDDLGMFSVDANERVKSAIEFYICNANRRATGLGLTRFHQRLAAFQDRSVRTQRHRWNDYDEFFGHTNPACYDEQGNVVDPFA